MSPIKRLFIALAGALMVLTGLGATASASTSDITGNLVTVTSANHAEVIAESHERLVILDFGATWCPPCQRMKPVLERLAVEYNGRILVGMVDVDRSRDLSTKYNIRYLPTLVPIRNGAEYPSSRLIGYPGEAQLRAWIDRQLAKG
ncbi:MULTISPECIES: thioredoxin family protein [Actinokineospora]|uniref:Thioredoxin domain-containing protein n=1 Tax=Actinokineospora fastidiosa TaxID=1816 RepID=A0A918LD55_9PSEU|nr:MULTISPECIES: thioredoxin family protein [Actinokineospora]UVS80009.1 Thioredoxin C-2 [Actinokineospora sp. UTMC 2448]GGS32460.1 hypothetical protein GCM10010171_28020 [Actinokineospora fastidiosa]